MKRREFIALAASAAVSVPFAVRGQQAGRSPLVGVLMASARSSTEYEGLFAAFNEGLRALGWRDGENVTIETRWGGFDVDLTKRAAKDLVALKPDLIVSSTTPTTQALAEETRTIPIVFVNLVDPIGSGFVASLPRPGANLTGLVNNEPTMTGKWLEMLKEIAPATERVAFLFSPVTAPYAENFLKPLDAVAQRVGVLPIRSPVNNDTELSSAVAEFARMADGSIAVMPDSFMVARTDRVIALAMQYRLPLISPYRFYTERGGLLSYGPDIADNYRRAAGYVDRILKGEKPGELPVQAPVKFESIINSKAAKALGLTVPPTLLATADEVIE
jgi:putative tryptophan/tyrosine transport system substrate-binding protein